MPVVRRTVHGRQHAACDHLLLPDVPAQRAQPQGDTQENLGRGRRTRDTASSMNFELGQQPLIVADIGQRNGVQWWRLTRPLVFTARGKGDAYGVTVHVPAGFETDFASVPRGLWNVFPPTGRWQRAAVIHDYLYRETSLDRFVCDAIFREAMRQLKVPRWRRLVMYAAVRLFGGLCRERIEEAYE